MVDRGLLTPELEAAAHRCAATSMRCKRFYMSATNGHLDYISVEKDNIEHFYSLINGEWTEVDMTVVHGDAS